ncbi:hypothetical protein ACFL96_04240 [Thermoproteota archaeon]
MKLNEIVKEIGEIGSKMRQLRIDHNYPTNEGIYKNAIMRFAYGPKEDFTEKLGYNELELILKEKKKFQRPEHIELAAEKILSLYDQSETFKGKYAEWNKSSIWEKRFNFSEPGAVPSNMMYSVLFIDEDGRFARPNYGESLTGPRSDEIAEFSDSFSSGKSKLLTTIGRSENFANVKDGETYKIDIREIRDDPSKYLMIKFKKGREGEIMPAEGIHILEFETNSRKYAESHVKLMGFEVGGQNE